MTEQEKKDLAEKLRTIFSQLDDIRTKLNIAADEEENESNSEALDSLSDQIESAQDLIDTVIGEL